MLYVPVVSALGKPLMPCHPARTRELVRNGLAVRRFNRGLFYIQLLQRDNGDTQVVAVGIDPGSKKEGFTVKSEAHTFLNIQADAVTWVKDHILIRNQMRRSRRGRNTPRRPPRTNRCRATRSPSTMARWNWKLRLCSWLSRLYPLTTFVVEDIKARTKGQKRWDSTFSPLQIGKKQFYAGLSALGDVYLKQGWQTHELRVQHSLHKTKNKLANHFDAHCVDSWVLANWFTGGHLTPDSTRLLSVTPLHFRRRQLHKLQPASGGVRKREGGTLSHGLKRGSLVNHVVVGLAYVGGFLKDRISLHSVLTGKRLGQKFKPADCTFLTYSSWRATLLPVT